MNIKTILEQNDYKVLDHDELNEKFKIQDIENQEYWVEVESVEFNKNGDLVVSIDKYPKEYEKGIWDVFEWDSKKQAWENGRSEQENISIGLAVEKARSESESYDLHSDEVQELLSDIELVTEIKKKVAENPEYDFLNKANFFEDFLHMFFCGGDVRPYDQEYYSSYQNDESFSIVGEDGRQCENAQVYKDLEPRAIEYGYSLESDNKFYPLEGKKDEK